MLPAGLLLSVATAVQAILGQPVPEWPAKTLNQWVQGGLLTLADLRGRVVLIRFFMESDCPYCRGTAPTLNEFDQEFAKDGLVVIGMYTPKPEPRPVELDDVRAYVKSYGFEFPIAVDADRAKVSATPRSDDFDGLMALLLRVRCARTFVRWGTSGYRKNLLIGR